MTYIVDSKRYEKLPYRSVGHSGLKIAPVSLGLWHNFGHNVPFETIRRICRLAFNEGITHFDLANNYGPPVGAAEENFGRVLKTDFAPYRDELMISTKAGYYGWEGPYGDYGSRKYLISSLDQSLRRLGLDYVDLFYHHRPDPDAPLEETMQALSDIVRQGKALYVGISNYGKEETERAMHIMQELGTPLIVNQSRYSIFDRRAEQEGLTELNRDGKLGLISFSPLAQGLLSDRYLNGIPEDSRIRTDGRFLHESDIHKDRLEQIRALNQMARERGQSLAEMALAWVLTQDKCVSVLVGVSKEEQLRQNLKAIQSTRFSDEELAKIDRISLTGDPA